MSYAIFEYGRQLSHQVCRLRHSRRHAERSLANWHDHVEILIGTGGRGIVCLDEKKYSLCENDIVFVNSRTIHSVIPDPDLSFDMIHINSDFCKMNGLDIESLRFCEHIRDDALLQAVAALFAADEHPHRHLALAAAMLQFLLRLQDYRQTAPPADSGIAITRVKQTMLHLHQHACEKLTLDMIAQAMAVNKYQLSREFKMLTGSSIFEYVNTLRCKEAALLLDQGHSVSHTAYACGFSNLSYFAKTYKKIMGELPGRRRKNA